MLIFPCLSSLSVKWEDGFVRRSASSVVLNLHPEMTRVVSRQLKFSRVQVKVSHRFLCSLLLLSIQVIKVKDLHAAVKF